MARILIRDIDWDSIGETGTVKNLSRASSRAEKH
jgi:hypothetical protein